MNGETIVAIVSAVIAFAAAVVATGQARSANAAARRTADAAERANELTEKRDAYVPDWRVTYLSGTKHVIRNEHTQTAYRVTLSNADGMLIVISDQPATVARGQGLEFLMTRASGNTEEVEVSWYLTPEDHGELWQQTYPTSKTG